MKNCDRCGKETNTFKMSWFNTQMICMSCIDEENRDKDYKKAKEAVYEQERRGNMNYEGIGWHK